jgi:hypothetical protein
MVPAALWMALTMLVSPEALPQEVVDEQARLDFGLASHPFTVQAMHPQGPPPPSLRLDRYAGAASGKPARHGERLAGGGCSAAHASWAANDETSRLSARRMGWGNGEEYSGRADMAGIPSLPIVESFRAHM